MTKNILNHWLEYTRKQFPISGVLQVGSSSSFALSRLVEWQTPALLLAEPDESRADKLSAAVQSHPGWIVKQTLVSNHEGEEIFYSASNPNESGLLKLETLAPIWRNIRTVEQRTLACTTIDSLLEGHKELSSQLNWLFIDSLAAGTILQGAQKHLQDFDVIIVRAVLNDALPADSGTTKAVIDSFLATNGYCYLCCEEELHPAVGKLLYIRDWKKQLLTERSSSKSQLEQLSKARDEQARLAAEQQAMIDELAKAKADLVKLAEDRRARIDEHTKEIASLREARDQTAKLATDRQAQIEQLIKSRDEAARLAEERKVQLEAAAKEKAGLVEVRDQQTKLATERQTQLEQLTKARDEQTKLATERQAEITKLRTELQEAVNRRSQAEAQMAEVEQRQQLMNEEMVRAEGQIDLIKDLLLRENGL